MSSANFITIHSALVSEKQIVANLLELYSHELSAVYPNVNIGEDGRFGYRKLPLYWSEPDTHVPLLIRHTGKLAGFALVTRSATLSGGANTFDVAEFFILRGYRGMGIARQAAFTIWNRMRGRWTVRVFEQNVGALRFWTRAIAVFVSNTPGAAQSSVTNDGWRTFSLTLPAGTEGSQ